MSSLIEVETLAAKRFAEPTAALVKRLKYLARRGDLPGACKIGSRWFCDLTAFDRHIAANDAPPAAPAVSLKDLVARARAERSASS